MDCVPQTEEGENQEYNSGKRYELINVYVVVNTEVLFE